MSNHTPAPDQSPAAAALKVGRRGPDKLLVSFSKTRFPLWLALSFCIHASLAGFICYGYIRDHYLDPEGVAGRKAAALAAEAAAQKPAGPGGNKAKTPTGTPTGKNPATPSASSTNTTDALLDQRKNTPVVKRITEAAKPGETPKQPGDLGISVEDTNTK